MYASARYLTPVKSHHSRSRSRSHSWYAGISNTSTYSVPVAPLDPGDINNLRK